MAIMLDMDGSYHGSPCAAKLSMSQTLSKTKTATDFPLPPQAPATSSAYSELGCAPTFRFCFRPTSQLFHLPPPHCRFPFSSPFNPHPRFYLIFFDFSFFQTLRGTKYPHDIALHACTRSQVRTTPATPFSPHAIPLVLNLIFPLCILNHVFPPPSSRL
ncbi:hypothetical protein L873DRAFT_1235786 [Choiromyces venosus 120613-1]|uniref:Uncharacterized protein n=1 Tax=Choiromyces venosus 120613-1 TaxID=1336337 RepID=A0A3N4JDH0_9PEZI|nr:hypothetical protein L873DRAFT_1235786 [Choiromyces venosus 120613-1]